MSRHLSTRLYFSSIASLLFLLFLATFVTGCFRYTPSRRELISSGKTEVAGPETFAEYQKNLRKRLDELLAQRSALLEPSSQGNYQIGKGDLLRVDVFGFPDLSGECLVNEVGEISLPLVGEVHALGTPLHQFQTELTVRFRRFVKQPNLRISVVQYNSQRVSVVGEVVKPGSYPLKRSGYLLTELLSDVGGVREGGGSRIYLIPAMDDQARSRLSANEAPAVASSATSLNGTGVEIDLEQLVGTLDKPPLPLALKNGDTLIVPEAGQFRVDGEVEKPGSFPVTRRTSALGAIAAAGGFTYAANVNEVEVIRDIGAGKKASMTVDLEQVAFHGATDVSLHDGDVVIVPSSPGRFKARQMVEAFRTILRGGVSGSVRYQ